MTGKKKSSNILVYAALILGAAVMIFPFLWMILTSFKTVSESIQIPPSFFPENWSLDKFKRAWELLPYPKLYLNTALLIVFRVLFAVVFSSMAGFAFAKLKFFGKGFFFFIVITQLMLPSQIFIIPQYQMIAKMGLLNTMAALVFPGLVSAFGTFFLRQAYMGIPDDLMEAAKLDGCNTGQIFLKIMAPLTKSATAALAVFTAVFAYTDLMWPLIVNTDLTKMTLSAGLSSLKGQFFTDYPLLMAGSLLAIWPMLILYIIFQKQFIEGITLAGLKG